MATLGPRHCEMLDAMYAHSHPIILGGGAGGGGKSHTLRACAIGHTIKCAKHAGRPVRTVLACKTYPEVRDRHITKLNDEYRAFGKVHDSQTHGLAFHFRNENIGVVALRNLDDPDKYRGTECVGGFIDEASTLSPQFGHDHVLDLLEYPIRADFDTPSLPLVMASNPDGPGFGWLKRMFVDGSDLLGHDPEQIFFVPFLVDDNPNAYARETLKVKLSRLQPHLRDARLLGLWNSPTGARFSPGAHNAFRTYERFPMGLDPRWPRIMGVDWGFADPYCALWHALEPRVGGVNIWTYREDYQRGLLPRDQAQRVKSFTPSNERIDAIYADPSMWNRATSTITGTMPISAADVYEEELESDTRFGSFQRGVWMQTSRIHGLNSLGEFLSHQGEYRWFIDREACPNLWGEMESAVFANRPGTDGFSEDIDKKSADHAITAAIYSLHTHLRGNVAPELKPEETIYERIIKQRRKRPTARLG